MELKKYDLAAETINGGSKIEHWAFFFLCAANYDQEELAALLPGIEFAKAISVIELIARKTEDRTMYDDREKARRDRQWMTQSIEQARKLGREQGLE